jgi:hypothetical protein
MRQVCTLRHTIIKKKPDVGWGCSSVVAELSMWGSDPKHEKKEKEKSGVKSVLQCHDVK